MKKIILITIFCFLVTCTVYAREVDSSWSIEGTVWKVVEILEDPAYPTTIAFNNGNVYTCSEINGTDEYNCHTIDVDQYIDLGFAMYYKVELIRPSSDLRPSCYPKTYRYAHYYIFPTSSIGWIYETHRHTGHGYAYTSILHNFGMLFRLDSQAVTYDEIDVSIFSLIGGSGPNDSDDDDWDDNFSGEVDNCKHTPNGPGGGTCTAGDIVEIGEFCMDNDECGEGGYCSMSQEDTDVDGKGDVCDNCPEDHNPGQEDTYPPQGNICGDACECEADMNSDRNVDSNDSIMFNADFGRNIYNNPCSSGDPCNGDFNCDHNVDANDNIKFNEDFGRNIYNDPCPLCPTDPWCVY